MRESILKQQLYAGKATFGVMCTFPSPPVVERLRSTWGSIDSVGYGAWLHQRWTPPRPITVRPD